MSVESLANARVSVIEGEAKTEKEVTKELQPAS